MLFDCRELFSSLASDEVNSGTLPTESTRSTDPVEIGLHLVWKIIIDDKLDLLDINTSGQEVGGDQDPSRCGPEAVHNLISVLLLHGSVHIGNHELLFSHGLRQSFDIFFLVTIDDALGNF